MANNPTQQSTDPHNPMTPHLGDAILHLTQQLTGVTNQLTELAQETRDLRMMVQTFMTASENRAARDEARRAQNRGQQLNNLPPIPRFYAVARGTQPGVYENSAEANIQTSGIAGSMQHRFNTMAEALAYIAENRDTLLPDPPLFVIDRRGEDDFEQDMNF
jgi:hypothetical protein